MSRAVSLRVREKRKNEKKILEKKENADDRYSIMSREVDNEKKDKNGVKKKEISYQAESQASLTTLFAAAHLFCRGQPILCGEDSEILPRDFLHTKVDFYVCVRLREFYVKQRIGRAVIRVLSYILTYASFVRPVFLACEINGRTREFHTKPAYRNADTVA